MKKSPLKWQFLLCFGAIDSKHITMMALQNSESHYFNNKGTHSFLLIKGVANAYYELIYVNVGYDDRICNIGVVRNCYLHYALERKWLPLSEPEAITILYWINVEI